MFKRLFFELIFALKGAKNNDLVKWITYVLFKKYEELFKFVCAKNKLVANISDARIVERAAICLLEDSQLNEQVCFAEQLNCFYDLQPESVSIAFHERNPMPFLGRQRS